MSRIDSTKLDYSIFNGITYLTDQFYQDCNFSFKSIFPSLLIGECLNHIPSKFDISIKQKLVSNIFSQKSPLWTFNYWLRHSQEFKLEPYPDDLDDTFYALACMCNHNSQLISGQALSSIVHLLTKQEINPSGPYQTWIVSDQLKLDWYDIDIAVNANIGYFLQLQQIRLQNLEDYFDQKIISADLNSPYYKGRLPVLYFLSRVYNGKYKSQLLRYIFDQKPRSSLFQALQLSSLIRYGVSSPRLTRQVENLLKKQNKNGSWSAADFYFFTDKKRSSNYISSPAISTAFCLEAISLYQHKYFQEKKSRINSQEQILLREIEAKTLEDTKELPLTVRTDAVKYINELFKQDRLSNNIITLTPAKISSSFKKLLQQQITSDVLLDLGLLNVYGWLAYTLYDDVQDLDKTTEIISLANIFNRRLYWYLSKLSSSFPNNEFTRVYKSVLDQMDSIIYWEIKHKKSPTCLKNNSPLRFLSLADKSLGHILSVVLLTQFAGISINSTSTQALISFFKYFLTAKQMNDDAHDWQEDLHKGFVNSAATEINQIHQLSINQIDTAQKIFWQQVIPDFTKTILNYTKLAREMVYQMDMVDKPEIFYNMLKPIENSTQLVLDERQKAIEFIRSYRKSKK